MFEPWFRRFRPRPDAYVRLFCFPHAGGGASFFRRWPSTLPASIELVAVQYPGREDRLREPCIDDMATLADHVIDALRHSLDRPIAFFGHSLGAAVAYEIAWRLEARYRWPLSCLFVSGAPGPRHMPEGQLRPRSDSDLLLELDRLGGTNRQFMQSPEVLSVLLPSLRGDYALGDRYRPYIGRRLDTPIVACIGDRDPEVDVEGARSWAEVTQRESSVRVFGGDHFYLAQRWLELVQTITQFIDEPTFACHG